MASTGNISLGWKGWQRTNTLAYYNGKRFYRIAFGPRIIVMKLDTLFCPENITDS